MGRSKLKTLKETTLNTFFEVGKLQGVQSLYSYNAQSGIIKFLNGSEILLKDLFAYPSDPEFDELGSLEITGAFIDEVGQITEMAWNIVKSRIRYKLDDYGLIPKILGTCNPSTGWVYKNYYKPSKEGTLPADKKFIQALVTDNPFISPYYIENLKGLPKQQRDRLLYGKWEVGDNDSLVQYDASLDLFTNSFVKRTGKKYITADIARMGSDLAVIFVWDGLVVIDMITFEKSRMTEIQSAILNLKGKYNVPNSNIICDDDGIGGGVVDNLKVKGFVNNSKALKGENYQNLKTQCYYKLADKINANEIFIECELSTNQKESIIQEIQQIKSEGLDSDNKLKIINKAQVKQNIGRSPDYSDALMMRMWFEFSNPGKYSIR